MNCSICNYDKNLLDHHLSYKPEIKVRVCKHCHLTMHTLASVPKEQRNIIISWVEQYGNLWENGNEQYKNSETRKESQKLYRLRKRNPNGILDKIKKMEEKIKIMERKKP